MTVTVFESTVVKLPDTPALSTKRPFVEATGTFPLVRFAPSVRTKGFFSIAANLILIALNDALVAEVSGVNVSPAVLVAVIVAVRVSV